MNPGTSNAPVLTPEELDESRITSLLEESQKAADRVWKLYIHLLQSGFHEKHAIRAKRAHEQITAVTAGLYSERREMFEFHEMQELWRREGLA